MRKEIWYRIAVILLSLVALRAQAKDVHFDVSGISGDLRENVEIHLSSLPGIKAGRLDYRRDKIIDTVRHGLQAMGYYGARIGLEQDSKDPTLLHVLVKVGEPVRVRSLVVTLDGDAQHDTAYLSFLKKLPLKIGDVLHHGHYEEIKTGLQSRALNRGYFDAKMVSSDVKVYPQERLADVQIRFDSGRRYRFGVVQIEGVTQSQRLIKPLIPFHEGDPYQVQQLASLSQSLSETRYFRQVDVRPLLKQSHDYLVPIHIGLEPKSSNLMETGFGFSTDEGPRMQVNWEIPWLNDHGHSVTTQFKVSEPVQQLNFNYRIPGKDPINDYYNLPVTFERKDQNDTSSSKLESGVHYWTKLRGAWQRDYFVRALFEDYTQGSTSGNSLLLLPGVSLNRLMADKSLDPEWGQRILLTTEFSQRVWGSDLNFTRLWGRTKWIYTPWEGARVVTRFEQGVIWGAHVDNVPPSLRFFAGGDQSVRGFGFETLSPKDSSGSLTGARYVTVGSMEYAHPVAEKWRLATFVDAGTATNTYSDPIKVGTGMGVRWLSPLGPIRFDLAFGVSETHVPWRLHFGLGAEL